MSLKASISGIRGIVGETFIPPLIVDYVSAFSQLLGQGDILIGRDSRPSGVSIAKLVKAVLNAAGRNVVDLGIVPTPVVLFGVKNRSFAGGIIITASHNPIQWNALKLVNQWGKFISPDQFLKLNQNFQAKKFDYAAYQQIGRDQNDQSIMSEHHNQICQLVNHAKIREKQFKVALDTVNGAGGSHTVNFLKKLNCQVVPINVEETGIFAHAPEPTPQHLGQLSGIMENEKPDIGFALDPDGDRLVVALNDGQILSEELTLALCVKHYLTRYQLSDIVINLSTSRITEDIARQFKVKTWRVPTGEIHVTEKMEEINAAIGGEGNGGVILPAINKCRDALVGIALILEMMADTNQSMAEIVRQMPEYYLKKTKIKTQDIDFDRISERILFEFKNEKVDNQDGIRIDFDDRWVLVRKSNTEPIIRIFAEAKDALDAEKLVETIKKMIPIEA